jgi:hypothetical protein
MKGASENNNVHEARQNLSLRIKAKKVLTSETKRFWQSFSQQDWLRLNMEVFLMRRAPRKWCAP